MFGGNREDSSRRVASRNHIAFSLAAGGALSICPNSKQLYINLSVSALGHAIALRLPVNKTTTAEPGLRMLRSTITRFSNASFFREVPKCDIFYQLCFFQAGAYCVPSFAERLPVVFAQDSDRGPIRPGCMDEPSVTEKRGDSRSRHRWVALLRCSLRAVLTAGAYQRGR